MVARAPRKKENDPATSEANDLRAELDALRQEVKTLREARAKEERESAAAETEKKAEGADGAKRAEAQQSIKAQFEDLEQTLKDVAGDAEKEIIARPIVWVAVAFFTGLLFGRLISR